MKNTQITLSLNKNEKLGKGSFSNVFKGSYKCKKIEHFVTVKVFS